ncbi:MAG TPA: cupin domain-containing protein [Nocardioidaceae bacterium]|nr:cupin domain-containing protein [Nocardioidaceae bacterium]
MSALDLLSGDARAFLAKAWASHVHLHHTAPERLTELLSIGDVDHLLTSTALRTPALRVAQDGAVIDASRFTRQASMAGKPVTGLVDGRKVLDLFDRGASLVLQGLHRYWPPLTDLVRDLELALGHPCQANAYLTPPGSQGFAVHSDSHDVFVFQTYGTKLWEVHADPVREVLMEPGVSMYLPTGTPHAARAQDTASLHVTVGINQATWRTELTRIVQDVLAASEFDERLPTGYPADPALLTDALSDQLHRLARGLADEPAPLLAERIADRFLTGRTAQLRGALTDRLAVAGLADDTVLERRPGTACVLRPGPERLRVLLGDRSLDMPSRLTEPMQAVAEATRLRPADLAAWLDEQSRLVLARRLVLEGLLQVAG